MRSFCINLDRRPERWEYVKKEFDRMYIDVYRFSAVDIKPGWVGCRQSHLKLLSICKNDNKFAIYEDDVKFLGIDWSVLLELPEDWDCLYLGASPKEPQELYSEHLYRVKNAHVTHAIIWHNRPHGAVSYILAHAGDIQKYDDYLATVIQPQFNCFLTRPIMAVQVQFQSDTCKKSDVSTILTNYQRYCK